MIFSLIRKIKTFIYDKDVKFWQDVLVYDEKTGDRIARKITSEEEYKAWLSKRMKHVRAKGRLNFDDRFYRIFVYNQIIENHPLSPYRSNKETSAI